MAVDHLSSTFAALADPTRRAILARLATGEATVTELAKPFEISLPAISRHLKVLERAGLIVRGRAAQWRPSRLDARPLEDATDWLEHYRQFWEGSLGRLDDHLRRPERTDRMTEASSSTKAHRNLTITRVLDAPRELVWKAWTEPEQFAYWFGAELDVPLDTVSLDVKPGGAWKAQMIGEDGGEMPFGGFYRDVQEPERLVLTFEEAGASDEERQVLTVTFNDVGGKTELTLHHAGVLEEEHFNGLQGGYNSFLDKLAELLAQA